MVCFGVSICNQAGQVLVSRHFQPLSRSKVEGLISSFPKLLESAAQHTYIDTDQFRFVFQPLDKVYLIMMTSKESNILQDLNTLTLFARIVQDTCACTDQGVTEKGFELIHAFDEVISGGLVENLDLGQIKTLLEMDSHEEKIHEMIEKNKELEAKAELKRKAKELDQLKKSASKTNLPQSNYSTPVATINVNPIQQQQPIQPTGKGMQLGQKPSDDFMATLQQQAQQVQQQQIKQQQLAAKPTPVAVIPAVKESAVHVIIQEALTATLQDGTLSASDLKGEFILKINDAQYTTSKLKFASGANLQLKSHPLVDKTLFQQNTISGVKPFPVGQGLGLVKYKATITEEELPVHIECWPNSNPDGSLSVSIQVEVHHKALQDIQLTIPIRDAAIEHCDGKHDTGNQLVWHITNDGILEFTTKQVIYPMQLTYNSTKSSLFGVQVLEIEPEIDYSVQYQCTTQQEIK